VRIGRDLISDIPRYRAPRNVWLERFYPFAAPVMLMPGTKPGMAIHGGGRRL
jgi:hypothetical protein